MPLNTLRLNAAPSAHPNDRITFIKPLALPHNPTPQSHSDYSTADTFLRAVAAQCLPIMKAHHLSVTTLEEHEPNREFIGRNFNNGEIIQLVLRSKSGGWLPFNMVQMVMMHELAHNTHMNHGKGFWKVRNGYAGEMRGLWAKAYTGEGFWGSGRRLRDMQAVMGNNVVGSEELRDLPVCGGTYRSRRRKRRPRPREELTWKEKRDRRIEKKFGKNGVSLGEDEDKRMLLEIGKKGPVGGKPRVAQSNRGRELRAAAALARFEINKQEVEALKKEEHVKEEEDQDDSEDYEDLDANLDDARDIDGQRLLDSNGNAMVRVCGDPDEEEEDTEAGDVYIKQELEELGGLERYFPRVPPAKDARNGDRKTTPSSPSLSHSSPTDDPPLPSSRINPSSANRGTTLSSHSSTSRILTAGSSSLIPNGTHASPSNRANPNAQEPNNDNGTTTRSSTTRPFTTHSPTSSSSPSRPNSEITCPICSLSNPSNPSSSLLLTCLACAHVLYPARDKSCWSCASAQCNKTLKYINAGDVSVCGICGERRGAEGKSLEEL